MLKFLMVIFYICFGLGLLFAFTMSSNLSFFILVVSAAITSAFFGVMCETADQILQLLSKIAKNTSSVSPAAVTDHLPEGFEIPSASSLSGSH